MNRIVAAIRKRASKDAGMVQPISDRSLSLDSYDGPVNAGPGFATVVVTDESIVDRDGDVVRVAGMSLDNWANAGAPWFWGHQQHPYPIGTSWNPNTGQLDVQRRKSQFLATCHFDMEDPVAKHVAGKVHRGFVRSVSVAFVPVSAHRREEKAQHTGPGQGWDFRASDVTEISWVGVGSNPNALLVDAPEEFRKCFGCRGTCKKKQRAPEPLTLRPTWKRLGSALDRMILKGLEPLVLRDLAIRARILKRKIARGEAEPGAVDAEVEEILARYGELDARDLDAMMRRYLTQPYGGLGNVHTDVDVGTPRRGGTAGQGGGTGGRPGGRR